jgi:hypothetical protein
MSSLKTKEGQNPSLVSRPSDAAGAKPRIGFYAVSVENNTNLTAEKIMNRQFILVSTACTFLHWAMALNALAQPSPEPDPDTCCGGIPNRDLLINWEKINDKLHSTLASTLQKAEDKFVVDPLFSKLKDDALNRSDMNMYNSLVNNESQLRQALKSELSQGIQDLPLLGKAADSLFGSFSGPGELSSPINLPSPGTWGFSADYHIGLGADFGSLASDLGDGHYRDAALDVLHHSTIGADFSLQYGGQSLDAGVTFGFPQDSSGNTQKSVDLSLHYAYTNLFSGSKNGSVDINVGTHAVTGDSSIKGQLEHNIEASMRIGYHFSPLIDCPNSGPAVETSQFNTTVPEPATIWLSLVGIPLVGLTSLRRRKSKSSTKRTKPAWLIDRARSC